MLKRVSYAVLFSLLVWCIYLGAYSVLQGELHFFNDVARDFLLMQEIDEKKIILIGARTNTPGLFHGPLWVYMNYPIYALSNGNPIAVGWFWIFLEVIFLLSSFVLVKKLIGTLSAFAFCLLVSIRFIGHINGIFHSEAAIFFIPAFLFTMIRYIETKRAPYLALHFFFTAVLVHMNFGIGTALGMLSGALSLWLIIRHKHFTHTAALLILPLFLSNYILFDLRHNLQTLHALLSSGKDTRLLITLSQMIENRITNTVSLQLLVNNTHTLLTLGIFLLTSIVTILRIRREREIRHIYMLFLFYYLGYMMLSVSAKGVLLVHYVYFLIPLTSLWLVSFLQGKYRVLFLPLIAIVFYLNLQYAQQYNTNLTGSFMNRHFDSWRSLSDVAQYVINAQKGEDFGYFVYAPDAFAYQPRYAMLYHFKVAQAQASEYRKKSTTYVIAAPPPANNPYMLHSWWREVPVRIASNPVRSKRFLSGFTVEQFTLNAEEQHIPHDKAIELGIHFR